MKFEIRRYGINIVPENEQDEAYLEHVLNLRHGGDSALVVRRNAIGLDCWGWAEVKPVERAAPSPSPTGPGADHD